jgi:alpha-L-fucosidase
MKKKMFTVAFLFCVLLTVAQNIESIQSLAETKLEHDKRMQWWHNAKFGMFIHWGLYSVIGKGEWVMWQEQISVEDYAKYANQFKPDKYNPDEWARLASDAGMKYMVMTTRHHDGFSLWDSKTSYGDFTIMNTPAKFDAVEKYVKAARKYNLKVGMYYSPLDWRFPGYFLPRIYRSSAEQMKSQTYNQVQELLTNYGKIDILWWDGGGDDWLSFGNEPQGTELKKRDPDWPPKKHYAAKPLWEGNKLNLLARKLQPQIILNDRANSPGIEWDGDYATFEQKIGGYNTARDWESCDILTRNSWGWQPNEEVKSLETIISNLVKAVTGNGNYLLNVGPKPDGSIEPLQAERLREVGQWLKKYGESIYETDGGPYPNGEWGGFTQKGSVIYMHVLDWSNIPTALPFDKKIKTLTCLSTGEVKYTLENNRLAISLIVGPSKEIDTIIKIQIAQ